MKKVLILLLFAIIMWAQQPQKCGYELIKNQYSDFESSNFQTMNDVYEIANAQNSSDTLLRIPVVVHIVYENAQENIDDSLVYNQIEVLNRDFRRLNTDTINTRPVFDSIAGDAKIEFYLAQKDPDGNPTSGITRTLTDEESFIDLSLNLDKVKSSETGGVDAWPVDLYLNIWVCDLSINLLGTSAPLILGFAYPPIDLPNWPQGSSAPEISYDGVVIHYEVFGRNNPLSNLDFSGIQIDASMGRTCVHEVGHYLGLRHIWGDGDCAEDDGVDDTPLSDSQSNFECDLSRNTCEDFNFDYPDMVENYMDYSNDVCQNMFSIGQISIMRTVLETVRLPLVSQGNTLVSVEDFQYNFQNKKNLVKIIDYLGRTIFNPKPNIPTIYIYDDGTVEKNIIIE